MILPVLLLAASLSKADKPQSIVISIGGNKGLSITADGKPMSCADFNAMWARDWKDRKPPPSLDCKTGDIKNLPKQ
ncbi:MAG TPA: hypothetical protein VKB71_15050 [Rhizomicrobium sp.]|nr:hypothetical protein [Rhizomicrobium sp.]